MPAARKPAPHVLEYPWPFPVMALAGDRELRPVVYKKPRPKKKVRESAKWVQGTLI